MNDNKYLTPFQTVKKRTMPPNAPKKTKIKKNKSNKKCNLCKVKLSLVERQLKCKCGNCYCSKHRQNHNCTYDYKNEHQKFLQSTLEENKIVNKQMDIL